MQILTGAKIKVRWTGEDYAKAFATRMWGIGAFNHVTKGLGYPLPSKSSLYRRAKCLDLKAGVYGNITL